MRAGPGQVTDRGATAATWWPWLVLPAGASALVASGLLLGAATRAPFTSDVEVFVNLPLALGFSTVAAGIWATRPDLAGLRRLGVLYTVVGLGSALVFPTQAWAHAARQPGSDLPGGTPAAWFGDWVWVLGAPVVLCLGLLLYPDGRLPGRRRVACGRMRGSRTGPALRRQRPRRAPRTRVRTVVDDRRRRVPALRGLVRGGLAALVLRMVRALAVRLSWEEGLLVEVEDDGTGIERGVGRGVGLRAMADRADELGGSTTVGRGPRGGTIVRLWLPEARS